MDYQVLLVTQGPRVPGGSMGPRGVKDPKEDRVTLEKEDLKVLPYSFYLFLRFDSVL